MKPVAHARFQVYTALLAALAGLAAVVAPLWTRNDAVWTWLGIAVACILLTQAASLILALVTQPAEAQQQAPIDFDAAWRSGR